jgi:acyl-CoA synthetase (AMP-forming)/AMP-acid ligase II
MDCRLTSLVSAIRRWPQAAGADRPALVSGSRQISYRDLAQKVGSLSGSLHALGIGPGERVALAMNRSIELVVALLAVLCSGGCACILEPKLGAQESRRRFAMTRMGWLVVDAAHAGDPSLAGLSGVNRLSFDRLGPTESFWVSEPDPMAASLLLFTSGSSGKPKGVLQSHRGLLVNAMGVAAHTGLDPGHRLLHVMPLHHTNGVNNQVIAPLLAGATVILADRFKAEDMPGLMARYQPTIITGVPTMYSRMLACEFPEDSLRSLRMARCGSAPITEELHEKAEAKLGRPLVVSYGLSEATCTSTMNPPDARRIGSVGTVLRGQEVRLVSGNGTEIDGPDREAEVCIVGPSLMLGYLDEDSEGRPRSIGDVLRTGDLGRFDADGYLYITGRIKDVIIRGGENLSPAQIEGALAKVAGVQACCVVGKPDSDLGEVPWAFVVRSADAAGARLSEQQLDQAVTAALSRIHKPAGYRFVDALPENSVGKIDRRKLAADVA